MDLKQLQLLQVEDQLAVWRKAKLDPRPRSGWLRAIREALGMPARTLARRLNVSAQAVAGFEQAEMDDTITLGTLRKAAAALDCELKYALVPRTRLTDIIEKRAVALAKEQLGPVAHTMALEDQAVTEKARKRQLKLLIRELLDGPRSKLW